MARRDNTMIRVIAALVCLVALMVAVMPCAMAMPVAQAGLTGTLAAGAMQCDRCCGHKGRDGWGDVVCTMQSQPAETARVEHVAETLGAVSRVTVSDDAVVERLPRATFAAWFAPPPLLLHPVLRI